MPARRPRILVISLSPLRRDARVLRQVELLAGLGDVTTIGYGDAPDGVADHQQVPDQALSLPRTARGVALLGLRAHRFVENRSPAARAVLGRPPRGPWDLVVANDARVLDLAHALAGDAPVWADMHEWAPEEQTDLWQWRTFVAPFMTHLCRRYLPRAALVTTVSPGIAALYQEWFGVDAQLLRNAPRFVSLEPSAPVEHRIRLVHSAAANPGRGLETMLDVVDALDSRYTLDLYLVHDEQNPAYMQSIERRVETMERVTLRPPVPPASLAATLSSYDIGIHCGGGMVRPNERLSFPNKLFDFVQARLAVVVGPSPEMAGLVREHGVGVVATSFDAASFREAVESLTPAAIARCKLAASAAARALSFEADASAVSARLEQLLDARDDA